MYDKIRLYKNETTDEIILDKSKNETILTKYTEEEYIFIGILLYFTDKNNMKLNISDISKNDCINGLLAFSYKTQTWIKTKQDNQLESYFKKEKKPLDASNEGYISIDDFKYTTNPSISSSKNYKELIDKLKPDKLQKLKEFGLSYGFISENILDISDTYNLNIKSGILKDIFKDISKQFLLDNPMVYFRSKEYYEIWRNKLIKLSVDNIERKKINRDFLSFILLNIFELAFKRGVIDVVNLIEINPDGKKYKKKKRKSKRKSKKRKSRS